MPLQPPQIKIQRWQEHQRQHRLPAYQQIRMGNGEAPPDRPVSAARGCQAVRVGAPQKLLRKDVRAQPSYLQSIELTYNVHKTTQSIAHPDYYPSTDRINNPIKCRLPAASAWLRCCCVWDCQLRVGKSSLGWPLSLRRPKLLRMGHHPRYYAFSATSSSSPESCSCSRVRSSTVSTGIQRPVRYLRETLWALRSLNSMICLLPAYLCSWVTPHMLLLTIDRYMLAKSIDLTYPTRNLIIVFRKLDRLTGTCLAASFDWTWAAVWDARAGRSCTWTCKYCSSGKRTSSCSCGLGAVPHTWQAALALRWPFQWTRQLALIDVRLEVLSFNNTWSSWLTRLCIIRMKFYHQAIIWRGWNLHR